MRNQFFQRLITLVIFYQFVCNVNFVKGENDEISDRAKRSIDDLDDGPVETQSAQCTITAGDVQASAQASTTKKLEGVCASRDLRKSFETLEAKLMQELFMIKLMVAQLQYPNMNILPNYINSFQWINPSNPYQSNFVPNLNPPNPSNYNFSPPTPPPTPKPPPRETLKATTTTTEKPSTTHTPIEYTDSGDIVYPSEEDDSFENRKMFILTTQRTTTKTPKIVDKTIEFSPIYFPGEGGQISDRINRDEPEQNISTATPRTPSVLTLKEINSRPVQQNRPTANKNGPRDFEIHRFNNTIISNDDTQIFTYFWKIEQLTRKLKSNLNEVISPIFTISGLHLRVRVIINHLNRDYLYLKIESVPSEILLREKSPNIILQSGNIFKEIETKKLFRHKIIIMDQGVSNKTDMISQEFFNTNSGFMIPTSAVTSNSYFKDDSILIKIIIYL